jgi:DNA-binding transcriptional ArsR family regulator
MANYFASLDGTFHALADPTRRAVLRRLGSGPASVKELGRPFEMALPSFMKHIAVLEGAGLIGTRKVGRVRTCHLKRKNLAAAESWIAQQREIWESRTDRLVDYVEGRMARELSP